MCESLVAQFTSKWPNIWLHNSHANSRIYGCTIHIQMAKSLVAQFTCKWLLISGCKIHMKMYQIPSFAQNFSHKPCSLHKIKIQLRLLLLFLVVHNKRWCFWFCLEKRDNITMVCVLSYRKERRKQLHNSHVKRYCRMGVQYQYLSNAYNYAFKMSELAANKLYFLSS